MFSLPLRFGSPLPALSPPRYARSVSSQGQPFTTGRLSVLGCNRSRLARRLRHSALNPHPSLKKRRSRTCGRTSRMIFARGASGRQALGGMGWQRLRGGLRRTVNRSVGYIAQVSGLRPPPSGGGRGLHLCTLYTNINR